VQAACRLTESRSDPQQRLDASAPEPIYGSRRSEAAMGRCRSMSLPIEIQQLEASIRRVWNERDEVRRLAAIQDIYHPQAVIFEPQRTATGHEAISQVVAGVLADMPEGFSFRVTGPTLGHHGVAITRWEGGPGEQVIVSGSDVARVDGNLIVEHYFYFDPAD